MIQDITVIKSKRKTLCIQIKKDMSIVVRVPNRTTKKQIETFINENALWIEKNLKKMSEEIKKDKDSCVKKLTASEVKMLHKEAKEYITERVRYYAPIVGVNYSRITIRTQKTRWGSCSSKGGLNFNCLLMKTPKQVIDYVVVHELCHRKEMNHSKKFWSEVEKVIPDYRISRKWLKDNGNDIMALVQE